MGGHRQSEFKASLDLLDNIATFLTHSLCTVFLKRSSVAPKHYLLLPLDYIFKIWPYIPSKYEPIYIWIKRQKLKEVRWIATSKYQNTLLSQRLRLNEWTFCNQVKQSDNKINSEITHRHFGNGVVSNRNSAQTAWQTLVGQKRTLLSKDGRFKKQQKQSNSIQIR